MLGETIEYNFFQERLVLLRQMGTLWNAQIK